MIAKEELGRRLKVARENAGFTQEEVAQRLEITRGALAQIEGGIRAPNSLHLARLAEIYGREVGDFLRGDFDESQQDALAVLFRADATLARDLSQAAVIRGYANLCREYTTLEALLGLDHDRIYPVVYKVPPPRTRWEAIRQGERLAELERSRLSLGDGPIRDMVEVQEPQGIHVLEVSLPNHISSLFLNDRRYGLSIIVNADHHARRQRFSYAHEYCHVLADRDHASLVSKAENRQDLVEVRANAFAAAFLMPADGVRAWLRAIGKGEASRSTLQVFDEAFDEVGAVVGQKRADAHSQDLQVYDVARLAHHFGVSYETALYRLLNLKIISDEELRRFKEQQELANHLRQLLEPEPPQGPQRARAFAHRFLFLALEAYRREAISRGKLRELCDLLRDITPDQLDDLILSLEERMEHGPEPIYIPGE